jgi:chlorobactene glucosyltransferase
MTSMTSTQWNILIAYAAIVAVWPIRHAVIWYIFRRMDMLSLRSDRYQGPDFPLVSAIIPAKDEEEKLADCLKTVAAQSYPNMEIIVVDDRSTDSTGLIARRFAERDARLRVISIRDLPAGWTGKTHALHVAAGGARGEWFWFVDADTLHHADSLSIVMEYARTHGARLASILPEMRCETLWEKVVQPLAGIVLMRSYPLSRVNDDRKTLAFANGQYLLIERNAYELVGGHDSVRDKFVEDIHLARLVKNRGMPIRTAIGTEISSTRMYTSLDKLVRGWARILYDALDRSPWPLVCKIVEPLIMSQTGEIALAVSLVMLAFNGPSAFAIWLLILSIVHQVLKQSLLYRMYRLNSPKTAIHALSYPIGGFVTAWICLVSIRMCLTGRVDWRGTSYGKPKADAVATLPAQPINNQGAARVRPSKIH